MAETPNSIITPQHIKAAVCTTVTGGGTDFSDTAAGLVSICTMGANGGRITGLQSTARATISAMAAGMYVSFDAGATKKLMRGLTLSADTVSATDGPLTQDWGLSESNALGLPGGTLVYMQMGVSLAAGVDHFIQWGDY